MLKPSSEYVLLFQQQSQPFFVDFFYEARQSEVLFYDTVSRTGAKQLTCFLSVVNHDYALKKHLLGKQKNGF